MISRGPRVPGVDHGATRTTTKTTCCAASPQAGRQQWRDCRFPSMFRRMAAPYLIMIVFWFGMAATLVGGLAAIGIGISRSDGASIVGGVVVLRLARLPSGCGAKS